MNVTLKYMSQTKKAKECRGYMTMKLVVRKGCPAFLDRGSDEAGTCFSSVGQMG